MAVPALRRAFRRFPVLALVALAGCDSGPRLVKVHGTVTYKGKPVTTGEVFFNPSASGGTRVGVGQIQEDGRYEMKMFPDRVGVVPGTYLVGVRAYTGSFIEGTAVYVVPQKYANPSTSGLTAAVAGENQAQQIDFRIDEPQGRKPGS
jgi:hypothetical protein